jgi:hypothetical protein
MVTIIPSDTDVLEAARLAAAAHLHLITDGRRTVLSPWVPPGWHKLAVTVKEASHGAAAAPTA